VDIRIEDVIFRSTRVVKEIPGSVKNQGNRGLFFFSFFFFFFFLYHVFVVKYKKQHKALAMAETKL